MGIAKDTLPVKKRNRLVAKWKNQQQKKINEKRQRESHIIIRKQISARIQKIRNAEII